MAMQTEMSLRDQALDADKARKASQTAQDASGEVKKGSEVPDVPPPEKKGVKPFSAIYGPLMCI